MPRVTIAVPVYNEAELLAGSLENLRAQTFTDFEVLIFDNASDDDTPRVAADFAARDPRFQHIRQPHNKGALRNFQESLEAATSPYFMWRACDDRSDNNYLEALVGLLDANPGKALAVGDIVSSDLDGSNARTFVFPNYAGGPTFANRTRLILGARAAWIYGLYRREVLAEWMNAAVRDYGVAWGFDHIVLLSYWFDDLVVGTRATTFRQIKKRIKNAGAPRKPRGPAELDEMIGLRQKFFAVARGIMRQRVSSGPMRRIYDGVLWAYTGKRLFRFRKVFMRQLLRAARPD